MVTSEQAKYQIERVHIKYLQKLGFLPSDVLLNGSNDAKPDLINPAFTHFFELKSRNFPHNLNNNEKSYGSSYGWWALDASQIKRHELIACKYKIENAWIFLRGHTKYPLSSYSFIDERLVKQREIFILPSGTHKLVKPSSGFYYLGLARIKRNYNFSMHILNRVQIYVEKGLEAKLKDLF